MYYLRYYLHNELNIYSISLPKIYMKTSCIQYT